MTVEEKIREQEKIICAPHKLLLFTEKVEENLHISESKLRTSVKNQRKKHLDKTNSDKNAVGVEESNLKAPGSIFVLLRK